MIGGPTCGGSFNLVVVSTSNVSTQSKSYTLRAAHQQFDYLLDIHKLKFSVTGALTLIISAVEPPSFEVTPLSKFSSKRVGRSSR